MHKQFGCIECLDEICNSGSGRKCGIENEVSPIATLESLIEEMEELNKIAQEHLDDYFKYSYLLIQTRDQAEPTQDLTDKEMTFEEAGEEQTTKKRKREETNATPNLDKMKNLLMLAKLEQGSRFALIRALAKRDKLQEVAMERFKVQHICKKHVKFAK